MPPFPVTTDYNLLSAVMCHSEFFTSMELSYFLLFGHVVQVEIGIDVCFSKSMWVCFKECFLLKFEFFIFLFLIVFVSPRISMLEVFQKHPNICSRLQDNGLVIICEGAFLSFINSMIFDRIVVAPQFEGKFQFIVGFEPLNPIVNLFF